MRFTSTIIPTILMALAATTGTGAAPTGPPSNGISHPVVPLGRPAYPPLSVCRPLADAYIQATRNIVKNGVVNVRQVITAAQVLTKAGCPFP